MSLLIEFMVKLYNKRNNDLVHLPFAGAPWQLLTLVTFYLYFVFRLGPKIMQNRPAYSLRTIMLAYNAAQVAANLFMMFWAVRHAYRHRDGLHCIPTDSDNTFATYIYYLNKFADLLETPIFIFRKKFTQVTFLHVYHHIMVIVCTYMAMCIQPGGHILLYGFMNCLVHAAMYSYYFCSIFDAKLLDGNSVLTKRNLTRLQIIQFILLIMHFIVPMVRGTCDYNPVLNGLVLTQSVLMLVLFGRFYARTYWKADDAKEK